MFICCYCSSHNHHSADECGKIQGNRMCDTCGEDYVLGCDGQTISLDGLTKSKTWTQIEEEYERKQKEQKEQKQQKLDNQKMKILNDILK